MVGTLHEIEQDIELLLEQLHRLSVNLHAAVVRLETYVAVLDGQLASAPTAPEYAADTGLELGHVERLGKVVVRTLLQSKIHTNLAMNSEKKLKFHKL